MFEHEAVRGLIATPEFMSAIHELNGAGNRFAAKNGATAIDDLDAF